MKSQNNYDKKNKAGRHTLPDFKTYYKGRVIKIVWYWHNDRHIEQWNRTESPAINSYNCGQLLFKTDAKTIYWGKNSLFNKWCCDNWISTCKRMKMDPYLTPYIKMKAKWIKGLNVKLKVLKIGRAHV